jgi:hypothetical protein
MDNQNPFGPPPRQNPQPDSSSSNTPEPAPEAELQTGPASSSLNQTNPSSPPASAMVGPAQTPTEKPTSQTAPTNTKGGPIPTKQNLAVIKRKVFPLLGKILLTILSLAVVGTAVYFIFFYRVTVNISPTPSADKITLNGKEVSPGIYKVMPGENSITISKAGYASFVQDKKLNPGEKLTLNFALQKEVAPTLIASGGKSVVNSFSKKVINYISKDGFVTTINPASDPTAIKTSVLSNGPMTDIRKILYSDDNSFALSLGSTGMKISDFSKSDALNQLEATLPPDPNSVSDVTWNVGDTSAANSQIIYDLKTPQTWMLLQADRLHTKSEILMYVESDKFSSLKLDWGTNSQQVLLAGGEIGILDLPSRSYEKIDEGKNFASASWGPEGTLGVALDKDNEIYLVKDKKLTKIGQKAGGGVYSWVSKNEILTFDGKRPVKINFDTNEKIFYAEITGIDNCSSAVINGGKIYFADKEGIKTASLISNIYQREGK